MTYKSFDSSSYKGQPVELLDIQYGESYYDVARTTSGDRDVMVEGRQYLAFTTSRDDFDDEGNPDDAKQLNIRVPRDHPFITQFDQREFPNMVSVRIRRAHLNDPELGTFNVWTGRLVGVSFEQPWMVLGCEKVATSLSRTGCRIRYMRQCPHTLYMQRCWVDKEAYRRADRVFFVSPDKTEVILEGGSAPAPGALIGGILEYVGLTRYIVAQKIVNGRTSLTLSRPMLILTNMAPVSVLPGCDRLASTCQAKFNNLDNYGGFDFIPPKGPFQGTSIV